MHPIFQKILGVQSGGPSSLGEAFDLIRQDRINKGQKGIAGDYNINPITTGRFGTTDSYGLLNDWVDMIRAQRANDLDSMPTQQELNYGQNLQQQYTPPEPYPVAQVHEPVRTPPEILEPAVAGVSDSPTLESYPQVGEFARDWYSSKGHPDSAERASLLAIEAINAGLDPYLALALGAQEGGWMKIASPQAPNNYLGWGETGSGSLNMGEDTLTSWLQSYMPNINEQYGGRNRLVDWGGSLSGYGRGSPFESRYNYNDSWVDAIASLMGEADLYRQQNYPNLPDPRVDYNFRY
jgi:hypothetical protein